MLVQLVSSFTAKGPVMPATQPLETFSHCTVADMRRETEGFVLAIHLMNMVLSLSHAVSIDFQVGTSI